jgi:hypothetical protein
MALLSQNLDVYVELVSGPKQQVDLEYHEAADADTFFKKVESGQLRWFKTKADLPSLVNFLHVVRFSTQERQLQPRHLEAREPAAPMMPVPPLPEE